MDKIVEENVLPSPSPFPVEFFSRRNNKVTQLVNNAVAANKIEGKCRWYDISLNEELYVSSIEIFVTGYSSFNNIEITIADSNDNSFNFNVKLDQNSSYVTPINRHVQKIRFRPATKFFSDTSINRINVIGYTKDEFYVLEEQIAKANTVINESKNRSSEIEILEEQLVLAETQAKAALEASKAEREAVLREIGQHNAQLDIVKQEIDNAKERYSKNEVDLLDQKSKLDELQNVRRDLESKNAELDLKIRNLRDEIRLFPSEISGFVKEGSRTIRNYVLLCLPFVAILFYIVYNVYFNAINVTEIFKVSGMSVWELFLTRVPYIIVNVAIIQVCGVAIFHFINKIIQINDQRLSLAKISIVARDVSTAAAGDTDLSGEERYEKETYLKMEMMREYLKNYLGDKYEYSAGGLSGLAKRLGIARKKDSVDPSGPSTQAEPVRK